MKKGKTLCSLDRDDISDHLDDIVEIVSTPKFLCRKCARVANKKKYLCKPMKIANKA